ncbi:MAG: ABC transporter permease [Acidobacteria bacterium]|nr:ABC transporter permease [Acidobacteriota bacterium]
MKPDQAPAAPTFVTAALRVFDVSVSEMLWSRRTIFMALVAAGPVVLALLLRVVTESGAFEGAAAVNGRRVSLNGPAIFGLMVWTFYLRFTVPVLGVFYGTALIADEVEDRTLTYLFTRPIPRGAVLAGKYLAYLVCTAVVVLPSVMLVYFLVVPILNGSIGREFPSLAIDLAMVAAGLAVYGALFALVGAWFRRPLLTGLVVVFGWEPIVTVLPGYMKYLTVAYYLQGLVPHAMPQGDSLSLLQAILTSIQTPLGTWTNIIVLAAIWLLAFAAALRVTAGREYVLEQ